MNKNDKKPSALRLDRRTVRALDASDLQRIAGGDSDPSKNGNVPYSNCLRCQTN